MDGDGWNDESELTANSVVYDEESRPNYSICPQAITVLVPTIGHTDGLALNTDYHVIGVLVPMVGDTEGLPLNTVVGAPPLTVDHASK